MSYKYLLPAILLLGACTQMPGGMGVPASDPSGRDGLVLNDADRPDYRPGGDPVLETGGGLEDDREGR